MMHTFSVKTGVFIRDVHPEMLNAWPNIARVFTLFGYDATITEVNDTIGRRHHSYHKTNPVRATDWPHVAVIGFGLFIWWLA